MSIMEEDDVLEVNLGEIVYQLIHKFWIIILAGVVCAVPSFLFRELVSTPVYTSSSRILIDVQDTQLSEEYAALVTSNEVLENTIDTLQLDYTVEQLRRKVSASIQEDTRLLKISAQSREPEDAQWISGAVTEYTIRLIRSSRGIENIRLVDQANLPVYRSGPSSKKVAVFAGALAAFLAACVISAVTFFRDTVCTPEQIKMYTGLDTLGMIPVDPEKIEKQIPGKKRGMINHETGTNQ